MIEILIDITPLGARRRCSDQGILIFDGRHRQWRRRRNWLLDQSNVAMEVHPEERLVLIVEGADRDDAVDLRTTIGVCPDADDNRMFLAAKCKRS